jgi:succinyl-CoA synthetase alpha subunit
MAILLDESLRGIVQGITGRVGRVQTRWMLCEGTPLVAGVGPGRGGQTVEGLPVYDRVCDAVKEHNANASVIFVPAASARDAALEAIDAGLGLVVIVTEHIPLHDALEIKARAKMAGVHVIGPNCPGLLVPRVGKLGIMPGNLFRPGPIGLVGRSATLSYEIAANLTAAGLGQSAAVGIGGDPVVCTDFVEVLRLFEADDATHGVVLVGEIGGQAEENAARFIGEKMTKPVVGFIAGRSLPPGRRFGHAGAIIRTGSGAAESKISALQEAGVRIADTPSQVSALMQCALKTRIVHAP